MLHRNKFDIAFVGLKPGIHEFDYEVYDNLFYEYNETYLKY
jgi:hypothetical protein